MLDSWILTDILHCRLIRTWPGSATARWGLPLPGLLFMFLLYLDASGTPDLNDVNSQHYVLLGMCMHERSWFALDRQLRTIKQNYCLPGTNAEELEIHVKQFAVTIKEQDEIPSFDNLSKLERRARVLDLRLAKLEREKDVAKREKRKKRYKNTDPYIHLNREERAKLLEDAIDVIANYGKIRLFAEAIDKKHPKVQQQLVEASEQGFTQVVARFDKFLQMKAILPKGAKGKPSINCGLLMLDHDESTQSLVEPLFKKIRQHGHPFGEMKHVIDVPFFGSSAKVGGLQLADVAAYVVRRYLDRGAMSDSHEEKQFKRIFQRFDRDSYGNLHGIRHYTPLNSCSCMICQERGFAVRNAQPHVESS
jgi:hypothetical protein